MAVVSGLGDMVCVSILKTFLMHKDLNVFISWVFRGLCRVEKIHREGRIRILEEGSSQMITVLRFLIEGG